MVFRKFESIIFNHFEQKHLDKFHNVFSLSFLGFRVVLTFKYVNDDLINQAEQFIGNNLSNMIERWQAENEL